MGQRISGIYAILHLATQKFYIGSTNDLSQRRRRHFYTLDKGTHPNPHLQQAYNRDRSSFVWEVLELTPQKNLLIREQEFLNSTQSFIRNVGYNILHIAGSPQGRVHSEATKLKISNSRKGKIHSKETRERISSSNKGRTAPNKDKPMTEEWKMKISRSKKGKPHTEEQRRKMTESRTGKVLSDEHKRNISKGKKRKV